jgi:6-phospho-beta-glucosidase
VKIAVIGGAGVRTPLLVNGLTSSLLPIDEIGLFDPDTERLALIGSLARSFSTAVRTYDDPAACVSGSDFVVFSIRVGGIAARARDEAVALEHGTVAQETVGAGGFAMALRTIPHAVDYARLVEREAPRSWMVSFTNPVGIVTQAMTRATRARVIGICDTPTELFEEVAHALAVPSARCYFDYFGLNHLGWLREVYFDGEPQLDRVWREAQLPARVYRTPLFDADTLQRLRLLPTEYLFYYYASQTAIENTRKAGETRGQAIAQLNEDLFKRLAADPPDPRRVYEEYLQARNAGYMRIESGAAQPIAQSPWAELTGYDKIALGVIHAIHFNTNAVIPLNVVNRAAIRDLAEDDVVEVPCLVNANGARPLNVGPVPAAVRDLLVRVKQYERLTVEAALTESRDLAERALATNPLVGDRDFARRLISALHVWD